MSTTIESLELEILSSSQSAESGLDNLTASLEKLKAATKGGIGLGAVANQIKKVSDAVNGINGTSVNNVTGLARAIQLLGGTKISSTIATQITAMSTALNGADFSSSKGKLDSLVTALAPLSNLPKTNLASYVNNIKKLPEALNALDDSTISGLAEKIKKLAEALKPLGDEMQKVANGFSAFPNKIQKLIANTNSLATSNNKASTSYINLWAKLKTGIASFKQVGTKIFSMITQMNDYIENVNLFTVSMGKYANEAQEYAEKVGDVMGIDPGEWMRNQGIFMTLATGFGVAGDRAYTMSQQLTQLGYDLSSFFNISYEDAMQKLQSGLSGELEPLRRLGYDLSQAKLQAVAMSLGIDKSVSSMTQAEKAQLRYYAIMTQVTMAHGDMSRTLDAPANQLRIFKAQVTQAARAIGSIFIPAMNALLPYGIAIAKVIRIIANEIASLVGFELPEVDYSGLESAAGGADESLDNAAKSAKKLKSYMLGFDELNVINPDDGNASDGNNSLDQFDFELPTYDFIGEATESRISQIVEDMKEWLGLTGEIDSWADLLNTKFGNILFTVGLIGGALVAWKITKSAVDVFKTIGDIKKVFKIGGAAKDLEKVDKELDPVSENTSKLTNKLKTLTKNLGLGIAVIAEVAAAALIIVGTIWLLGKMLEQVGIAWEPVIDNGADIAIAIGVGTALLVGIGLVTAELGKKGKSLIVDIALGTAILAEVSLATDLFLAEIWVIGKLLDEVGKAWQPVIDNGETIAIAIGIGTGLLLAIGVVTWALGQLTLSSGGTVAVAIAAGTGILAEISLAADLFLAEIWVIGKLLTEIGKAWQPVLDNGETIKTAIEVGSGILIAIGAVTAILGAITLATGGSIALAIAAGTGLLAEISFAADLFLAEILVMGKLLEEIGKAWQPVLDNGETIEDAITIGSGLLIAIGAACAVLGAITLATGGTIALAIAAGALLLEGIALETSLFLKHIKTVGDDLVAINNAWQPVLENGEDIEKAIDIGTDLLVAIGVVSAALGVASVVSVGLLPLAIAAGAAMLLKLADAFGDFCDSLSDVSDDIKYTLAPKLANVNDVLPDAISDMGDFVDFMKKFAGDMVVYAASTVISGIASSIDKFVKFFAGDPIDKMAKEVAKQYSHAQTLRKNLEKAIPEIEDATELLKEYNSKLADFEDAGGTTGVGSTVRKLAMELTISVVDKATDAWSGIKDTFSGAKTWFQTNVSNPIGTTFSTLWENVKKGATEGWDKIVKAFSKDGSAFSGLTTGIVNAFKTVLNWLVDGINKVIALPFNTVNGVIDTIKKISVAGIQPFKNLGNIPVPQIPKIPVYAEGGFVGSGQMFIAREAGPELVGTIGNRSAVANNDQIVESVSTGVYQAVVAALGSGSDEGGDTQIIINLDGEKIYENQQKVARNRGYNLGMGAFNFG